MGRKALAVLVVLFGVGMGVARAEPPKTEGVAPPSPPPVPTASPDDESGSRASKPAPSPDSAAAPPGQPAPSTPAPPPPDPPSVAPTSSSTTALPSVAPRKQRPTDTRGQIPDVRFVINNLLVARVNPLGLEDQIRAGFQFRLSKSLHMLLRDTYLFVGIYPKINPAFGKFGPSIELQPLSMFNVRFAAEAVDYFSTFGFLQSFDSPVANYSDSTIRNNQAAKLNYISGGIHMLIEPTLTLKIGPIVLRDKFAFEYWNMHLRTGDTVWYEPTLDTLVPGNGYVISNDLDLMFVQDLKKWQGMRLAIGARYTVVKPLYQASDFKPGDDHRLEDNGHHRIGVIAGFTFFDKGFTKFNKPTLLVIAQWYVDHRWRTGADTPTALPYIIVGFSFQSDLLQ